MAAAESARIAAAVCQRLVGGSTHEPDGRRRILSQRLKQCQRGSRIPDATAARHRLTQDGRRGAARPPGDHRPGSDGHRQREQRAREKSRARALHRRFRRSRQDRLLHGAAASRGRAGRSFHAMRGIGRAPHRARCARPPARLGRPKVERADLFHEAGGASSAAARSTRSRCDPGTNPARDRCTPVSARRRPTAPQPPHVQPAPRGGPSPLPRHTTLRAGSRSARVRETG